MGCMMSPKHNTGNSVKCDTIIYDSVLCDTISCGWLVSDSIYDIVMNARSITCELQALNPLDTVRKDTVRTLSRKMIPVVQFLFSDSNNFKSNDIVYGHFSSLACYKFTSSKRRVVFLELDFGLRKWRLLSCDRSVLYTFDMKENYLQFLRLTRLCFPDDLTLELLYNNLTAEIK